MRNPAILSSSLAILLGIVGLRAPVATATVSESVTASAPSGLTGAYLVLLDAPALEVGADAFSEIVPLRTPVVDRQERSQVTPILASGSARPSVALQRALAALGRRAHPPTAPPRSD